MGRGSMDSKGWTLVIAAVLAMGSIPVVQYQVNAQDDEIEQLQDNQKIMAENVRALDEQTRLNAQTVKHSENMLRALSDQAGLPRLERPPMPESKIKPLE